MEKVCEDYRENLLQSDVPHSSQEIAGGESFFVVENEMKQKETIEGNLSMENFIRQNSGNIVQEKSSAQVRRKSQFWKPILMSICLAIVCHIAALELTTISYAFLVGLILHSLTHLWPQLTRIFHLKLRSGQEMLNENSKRILAQKLSEAGAKTNSEVNRFLDGADLTLLYVVMKKYDETLWIEKTLICKILSHPRSLNADNCITNLFLDSISQVGRRSKRIKILHSLSDWQTVKNSSLASIFELLQCGQINLNSFLRVLANKRYPWGMKIKAIRQNYFTQMCSRKFDCNMSCMRELRLWISDLTRLNLSNSAIETMIESSESKEEFLAFAKYLIEENVNEGKLIALFQNPPSKGKTLLKSWLIVLEMSKICSEMPVEQFCKIEHYLQKLMDIYSSFSQQVKDNIKVMKIREENMPELCTALDLLCTYKPDRATFERSLEVIATKDAYKIVAEIHQLVMSNLYQGEHLLTLEDLTAEIAENLNPDDFSFSSGDLRSFYASFESQLQFPAVSMQNVCQGYEKIVAEWNSEDIRKWANSLKSKELDPSLTEMIAVVARGFQLHKGYLPRETQILSVRMLLDSEKKGGTLAQIKTGEGKSVIVAMMACILALQGRTVDVLTTSEELSIPEVTKLEHFFDQTFGLTIGEISDSKRKKETYQKDIVYGTIGHFMGDILRSEFLGQNIRGSRKFDVIIVDEVDSLLYDNRFQTVKLSEGLPMMDHLELVLATIWNFLQMLHRHFVISKSGKNIFIPEKFTIDKFNNFQHD